MSAAAPVVATIGATLWCAVHSLLVNAWSSRRWSRIAYNLIASISLLILMFILLRLPADPLWRWSGPWQALRVALTLAGLMLGWWGSRAHDGRGFLGLRRLSGTATAPPRLTRDGALGHVRHPWYAAGILLLPVWPGISTTVNVAWRTVFVVYLIVGAWIEDHRLERVFGEEFRRYKREVPGFVPRLPGRRRN